MDTVPPQQKKGLGVLAWLGIGCGGIIVLGVIAAVILGMVYGGDIKKVAEEMQKNPARATATIAMKASAGELQMVAEDDVNKRYTLKAKSSGGLTTIYWSEKNKKPETVQGDFSAIPADEGAPAESPSPSSAPVPAPAPAQ